MGTDTQFKQPDFWPAGPYQAPAGRSKAVVARRYGDRHDFRYTDQERSTSNVQRSTLNGGTGRAHAGRDMGTDTLFGRPEFWLGGPDQAPAGRSMLPGHPDMVTGTISRGQTRCPVYRSGTFNVQRSTLNFQRGDRKGSSWAEYGDRLGVCHERLRGRQGAWNVTLRRSSIHRC